MERKWNAYNCAALLDAGNQYEAHKTIVDKLEQHRSWDDGVCAVMGAVNDGPPPDPWQDTPSEPGWYWCHECGNLEPIRCYRDTQGAIRAVVQNDVGETRAFVATEMHCQWLRIPDPPPVQP